MFQMSNQLSLKLNGMSGGKILDIGTGKGEFVEVLKKHLRDYDEIWAIDNNEKAINRARVHIIDPKVEFRVMDAGHLEFDDNSFDLVCLSNSLHHLKNIEKILAEMKRVVKPKGMLLINEMYSDNQTPAQMSHVYFHHFSAKIARLKGIYHEETLKKDEIMGIVKKNNIQILDYFSHGDYEIEKDEEKIYELYDALNHQLEEVKSHPEYSVFAEEAADIKRWIECQGFTTATELMIIGKK